MDEVRITPAGDPFYAASSQAQDHPHACYEGIVFLGRMTSEAGEEQIEALPCRRCAEEGR